jgi:hypothetical protein
MIKDEIHKTSPNYQSSSFEEPARVRLLYLIHLNQQPRIKKSTLFIFAEEREREGGKQKE